MEDSKLLKIIISIAISIIAIFSSCEKEIDINPKFFKSKIVVNSLLEPDSIIKLKVYSSLDLAKGKVSSYLNNANILIYEDDVLLGNLKHIKDGEYIIEHYPQVGKIYRIEVKCENYDDVNATIGILNNVPINKIDASIIGTDYWNRDVNISVNFDDPANEKNYYWVRVSNFRSYIQYIFNEDYTEILDSIYVDQEIFFDLEFLNNINQVPVRYADYHSTNRDMDFIFSDEVFNGNNYTLNFLFGLIGNKWLVNLYSIPEETYKYFYTASKQIEQSTDLDAFGEPIPVLSNINNGLGIFGSRSVSKDSVSIISYY